MAPYACPSESATEPAMQCLAALYAEHAGFVRRLVRGGVRASDPLIEDACQVAWSRLLGRRDRLRGDDAAIGWLVSTATRVAFRESRRERRDASLEELIDDDGDLPRPGAASSLEVLAEQRARLDSLQELPERQQRLMWLKGLGCSYTEMAQETGTTVRTVERQLQRARRRLASGETVDS